MKNEEEISDFSSEWNNSDQILVVQERNLHVHRCILSIWSPVFDRMFNGHFKETTSQRVELKGKIHSEVEEMLKVMYNRSKDITGLMNGNLINPLSARAFFWVFFFKKVSKI